MRRQHLKYLFLGTQQLLPHAASYYPGGSQPSLDPVSSGHTLASPGPTGPSGPATHHCQG